MKGLFNDRTMVSLEKSLDAAAARQSIMAHNLANINTPNFKRRDVLFEDELRRALSDNGDYRMAVTNARHITSKGDLANVRPTVINDKTTSMRLDGNNVDIDMEMTLLAANQLNYNAFTQLINGKYSMLRYVINEGRR